MEEVTSNSDMAQEPVVEVLEQENRLVVLMAGVGR